MTSLSRQIHKRAFLTHFEIACEFAILICATDMLWLTHDIVHYGLNAWYCFVGVGLSIGLLGTIYVLIKHHLAYAHRFIHKHVNKRVKKLKPISRALDGYHL